MNAKNHFSRAKKGAQCGLRILPQATDLPFLDTSTFLKYPDFFSSFTSAVMQVTKSGNLDKT